MMRSSGSKGKDVPNGPGDPPPIENGVCHHQTEDGEEVQRLAARVVDNVVKLASETARSRGNSPARPHKLAELKKLPTIQIDTVPSLPRSPPSESGDAPEPTESAPAVDEEHIDIQLHTEQQSSGALSDEERESVRTFVEEVLAQAMVVAEKKLKFAGLDDEEEEDTPESAKNCPEPVPSTSREEDTKEEDMGRRDEALSVEAEIREAAEKVVEEVLSKAQERVDEVAVDFPIKFEDAPEDVRELASSFIKDIVGRAITTAEEKAVPTVPFNFEDVDLIKTSGPWYVRVREGFMRVLRSACFCTPRRHDS